MFYLSILGGLLLFIGSTESQEQCVQRDKNTREIAEILDCEEGCCGNELTYQYCCEMLNPDKMYTQYDRKRGLSPIHYFLMGLAGLIFVAFIVTVTFCLIRSARMDRRDCGWI